ncbi:MAG: diaminopimelate decarboxylase, partial [Oscillospiraceae bacterium]
MKICAQYGTPTYVFDRDILEKRVEEIKKITGEDIHLCYAMKANPFLSGIMANLV